MLELFQTRGEAESMIRAWDEDEPDQAGVLEVVVVEVETVLS